MPVWTEYRQSLIRLTVDVEFMKTGMGNPRPILCHCVVAIVVWSDGEKDMESLMDVPNRCRLLGDIWNIKIATTVQVDVRFVSSSHVGVEKQY